MNVQSLRHADLMLPRIARRLMPVAICALFTGLYTPPATADTGDAEVLTMRMEGRADGAGFSARNKAIAAAQGEVLQQLIHSFAPAVPTELVAPILDRAAAYMERCDILKQDNSDDRTRVEIEAHIATRPLRQDLAAIMLPRLPKPPRALLLMGEKLPGDQIIAVPDNSIAERVLRAGLEKLGLKIDPATTTVGHYNQQELIEIVNGGIPSGARFAQESTADVVIVGIALTESLPNAFQTNVHRTRAAVSLKVFRGIDGKMMDEITARAIISGEDAVASGEEAIRDACAKVLGDTAVSVVLSVLGAQNPTHVHLVLNNPGPREQAEAVLSLLRVEPEVSAIGEPFYSAKTFRVTFEYEGQMSYLVALLSPGPYPARELIIDSVLDRVITARWNK